jgi:hypothetical protein
MTAPEAATDPAATHASTVVVIRIEHLHERSTRTVADGVCPSRDEALRKSIGLCNEV